MIPATPRRIVSWPTLVDLVVFDFDGVMTDNSVLVLEDGTEAVRCHRGDGLGIARLRRAGFAAMILSTETNPVVAARGAKLGLGVVHGCDDKAAFLERWLIEEGLDPARVVYVGNDVNDLDCLRLVGFPVVVADAVAEVIPDAALVLDTPGGHGAVREICDLLIARSRPTAGAPTAGAPTADAAPRGQVAL